MLKNRNTKKSQNLMEESLKGNGNVVKCMEKAIYQCLMESLLKQNGKIIRLMEKEK